MSSGPPTNAMKNMHLLETARTGCHAKMCFRETINIAETRALELALFRPWRVAPDLVVIYWTFQSHQVLLCQMRLSGQMSSFAPCSSIGVEIYLYQLLIELNYVGVKNVFPCLISTFGINQLFRCYLSNLGHDPQFSKQLVLLKSYAVHLNLYFLYC